MSFSELDPATLSCRYQLLCRASHTDPDEHPLPPAIKQALSQLDDLIHQELPELARKGSPHHIADLLANMSREYQRLAAFCEFPELGSKVVVGIGGAFSTGKSSFINTLLGGPKRLATEVDETTSLPSYLMWGEQEQITALNLFHRRVGLSQEEFLSLTHEEKVRYGSQVSALLKSAYLTLPEFPWRNLSLLDTPGYSKPDDERGHLSSDANIARSQLNACQYIVWLVQADAGVISENDLAFLATLRRDIPLLVVISRADKKPEEDIQAITQLVRDTLAARGITALDVLPFSSRKKRLYPVEPIQAWLEQWEQSPQAPTFAINFSKLFFNYRLFLDQWRRHAGRLHKINRILALADNDVLIKDAHDLKSMAQQECDQAEELGKTLTDIERRLFQQLRLVADVLNMSMPEPGAMDLLQPVNQDLAAMLRELRERRDLPELDLSNVLHDLTKASTLSNLDKLLLRTQPYPALQELTESQPITPLVEQLRQPASPSSIENLLP
ncbi:dynamin family protein [Photobacterium ganghwense]|uniref:dynamin family protein n=1 Tax=Photobacterium ganghwense TaxID=320778 RepID=UPI001A8C8FC3|nr:dynamin family protein [Photobacterium ganghwense]QSV17605.1 dynamin family protein [Photobacterium ganghwense]